MSQLIPRIRGAAFQKGSGWAWKVLITIGPDREDNEPIVLNSKDSLFLNRDAAINDMRAMLPDLMKTVCEAMGLPEPEGVLDLKENRHRTLEDFAEPIRHGGRS